MAKMFVKMLLDASGSMLSAQGVTVAGFNAYVDTLDKDATVSVARFATPYGIRRIHTNVRPNKAHITVEDYPCVGGTPLYDAIGQSIQEINDEAKEYDRVVFVIQTDGANTEHNEFTLEMVKRLLQDKQDGEGWLVVFLGANMDAMAAGEGLGIRRNTMANYSTGNSMQAFAAVSRSTRSYGAGGQSIHDALQNASFTDEERNRIK